MSSDLLNAGTGEEQDSSDISLDFSKDAQGLTEDDVQVSPEENQVEQAVEMNWYVVQTKPGHEKKACLALADSIRIRGLENNFGDILIPEEQTITTTKTGKQVVKAVKIFPSYIFIEMAMKFTTFELVKSCTHVLSFVGTQKGKLPDPMKAHEIDEIKRYMKKSEDTPRVAIILAPGMKVKISKGTYAGNEGEIVRVDETLKKAEVKITIFNREVSVSFNLDEVEPISE